MLSLSDQNLFDYSLLFFVIITPSTVIALHYLTAPYGKHQRPGWGPTIPAPLAWFLMESPTLWLTLLLFPLGKNHSDPTAQILILPYLIHYFHRTVIYPSRLFVKTTRRRRTNLDSQAAQKGSSAAAFPVSVALMGFVFNLLNAYLQARWVSHYADYEGDRWFWWRFAAGVVVFAGGMAVNVRSDYALLGLKNQGGGYKIPRGGCFESVSCPNYLGEMLEWLGWALMTWSWAGLVFFGYTCANLVPRAASNHKWYLDKFGEDYPKNRKAVIPFVF